MSQRSCPSCREPVADDALFCSACGSDLAEKAHRSRLSKLNKKALYIAVSAGAVIIIVLVAIVAGGASKRRAASAVADSVAAAKARQRLERGTAEEQNVAAFRATSRALVADYNRKIDDLLEKAGRERRQLSQAKRLTSEASDLLGQIESKLRDARSAIGGLEGAPNQDSRKAQIGAIEQKLAEARKMFVALPR